MEQMTAGMTSYFLSISRLQESTSVAPAPALSGLSPVGSAILAECGKAEERFGTRVELPVALSEVHLSRLGNCKGRKKVLINLGKVSKCGWILKYNRFILNNTEM